MLLEGNEIIQTQYRGNIMLLEGNEIIILCYWKVHNYRGNIMLLEGNEIITNTI